MADLVARMQKSLDKAGLSWSKSATLIGLTPQAAAKWKKGQISNDNLEKFANLTNTSFAWLMTGEGEMTTKPSMDELRQTISTMQKGELEPSGFLSIKNPVPIISWVAAGSWSNATAVEWLDDDTEYLPRPANLSAQGFCLKVRGVSMLPEFRPDEIIFVEPNIGAWELKNGDLVVVREQDNQEATFKQLIIGDTSDDMYLKPLNPDWHEQKMIPKSEWVLVGKVVGKWVKY